MKTKLFPILTAASLLVALAVAVPAQAAEIKCRIPFGFTVNGKALPAGTYTLSTQHSALFVRGNSGGAIVLANTVQSEKNAEPKAVFEKYGDQYFLREAWLGAGNGRQLLAPHVDRDRKASVERIVVPAL